MILRDGAAKASSVDPYTTLKPLGSDNPRDLWKWLHEFQDKRYGIRMPSEIPLTTQEPA